MSDSRPVIVHPPLPSADRRLNGEILGLAHSLVDVAELLQKPLLAFQQGLQAHQRVFAHQASAPAAAVPAP